MVDIVLFSILRLRLLDSIGGESGGGGGGNGVGGSGVGIGGVGVEGRTTEYGNGMWITLASAVVSWVVVWSAAYTAFSRAVYPRKWETEQKVDPLV